MIYLADNILNSDFNIYTLLLFIAIGFLAGFMLKINFQTEKSKMVKLQKEAEMNQARIAGLKEKIDRLEKENLQLTSQASDK
jgi:hypothetical protein